MSNSTHELYIITTSNINCKFFGTFFNARKGLRQQFIIIGNKVGRTSFQKRSICLQSFFCKHGDKGYCRRPRTFFGDASVICRRCKRSKAFLNELKHRNQANIFTLKTFIKKLKPHMTALYYSTAKTGSKQLSKCPIFAYFPLFVEHCCKQFCTTKHSVLEPNPLCVMSVSFTQTGNVRMQFSICSLCYDNVKHKLQISH